MVWSTEKIDESKDDSERVRLFYKYRADYVWQKTDLISIQIPEVESVIFFFISNKKLVIVDSTSMNGTS